MYLYNYIFIVYVTIFIFYIIIYILYKYIGEYNFGDQWSWLEGGGTERSKVWWEGLELRQEIGTLGFLVLFFQKEQLGFCF